MVLLISEGVAHRQASPVFLLGSGSRFVMVPFQIYGVA